MDEPQEMRLSKRPADKPASLSAERFLGSTRGSEAVSPSERAKRPDIAEDSMYGASRVFDLFTLMAITLAFAILFAIVNLLTPAIDGSPAAVTCGISGYVILIALAQMFLFGGKNPRMASVIVGPAVMLLILTTSWIVGGGMSFRVALVVSICTSITFGFFTGYLSGTVVAGVFLVADILRGRYRSVPEKVESPRELSFDEIE